MKLKEAVPIVTANFQPLRFVLRNEGDAWEPTLDQINSCNYDYVKLHRISTYLDVGIAPYSMGVCFDGTLVLPAIPQYKEKAKSLLIFNQTLSELLIGGIYCEAVTPDDIGYGSLSFTAYARTFGGASGPSASFHQAARTKHIGELDVIRLLSPETISVVSLQESLTLGRNLLAKLGELPHELVLYGTTFFVRSQWDESLINIWTITERIIEFAWQEHVIAAFGKPTKKRKAFLEDHRTWTTSAKLEVLFQKSLLPVSTLNTLDEVRKARNDFAHRGISPTHEIATKAIKGCFELASLCSSAFKQTDMYNKVVSMVVERCNPGLFPQKTHIQESKISHWLPIPPLPGDNDWGDRPFEIVEDLTLKTIAKAN